MNWKLKDEHLKRIATTKKSVPKKKTPEKKGIPIGKLRPQKQNIARKSKESELLETNNITPISPLK